jgi:hypothetical protein
MPLRPRETLADISVFEMLIPLGPDLTIYTLAAETQRRNWSELYVNSYARAVENLEEILIRTYGLLTTTPMHKCKTIPHASKKY